MSLAHAGSNIKDLIIPVDYQDTLFHFYWNKVSGRGHEPIQDVTTIVPDSKFGQVLAIEDATTNLWENPGWQDGTLNKWNTYSTYSATGTYTVESDSIFQYRLRLEKTDNGTGRWGVCQNKTWSTNGSILTDGFYIKRVSSSPGAQFVLYNDYLQTDGSYVFGSGIGIDLNTMTLSSTSHGTSSIRYMGNGWYYVTFTTKSTINKANSSYFWIDTNAAVVFLAYTQKEAKGWPTSFVNGSRGVGVLEYPKEMFPQKDFTVNMWISHTGDTRIINNTCKLFSLGSDITTSRLTIWNFFPITPDAQNRRIISDYGNDEYGGRQYRDLVDPVLFVPGQWEMFTITFEYSTKKFTYYRNGNYWDTYTPVKLNTISSVYLYNSGWKYSNLLISPRVFSQDEIRLLYQYGKPLYDPYNYYTVFGA